MSQTTTDLQVLRDLNKRFIHNFVTNDVVGHDAILHPEFIEIGSSGAQQDRASYLQEWATGFDPEIITYWDMRDERISIFGGVALVRATTKWVRQVNGAPVVGMTRYTAPTFASTRTGCASRLNLPRSPNGISRRTAASSASTTTACRLCLPNPLVTLPACRSGQARIYVVRQAHHERS